MTKTFVSLFVCSTLCLAACGKEEEDNGTLNDAAVRQSANTAFQATQTASTSGDGQVAAFQMLSVGTAAMGYVTPAEGRSALILDTATRAAGDGCACTEGSCTFTACGNGTGFVIDGTIAWTETSLDCDYTVTGGAPGQSYSFSVACDLDYTATSLAGTLDTSGSLAVDANGQNVSTEWDSNLVFNDVGFANGQPTSGSMSIDSSVTVDGETYSASGTVAFGG